MNFHDPILPAAREARLRYLDADFQVMKEGEYVRCAVSGRPIRLEDLRYWDVARQVAYESAAIAFGERLAGLR